MSREPPKRSPTTPYGALIETRLRVVTWNLWWRLGEWQARAEAIAATLKKLCPDLVCLQEVWQQGGENQAAPLADRLGMEHAFAPDQKQGDLDRGIALLSRWPLSETAVRALPVPPGVDDQTMALRSVVDGPRGRVLLVTTHLLPFPPRSAARQEQVRALVSFIAEAERQPPLIVLCGDFNAAPDSDEIRLLTGRHPPAAPGWTFLDAWETAGDGSPGYTMAKTNPNAAPLLLPNLRWNYIFVNWPSLAGGGGHPVHAEIAGAEPVNGIVASDHYAVVADLRY
jgi:endonuclease/exonuclease/phosphatase family metal-dependent hydrolase